MRFLFALLLFASSICFAVRGASADSLTTVNGWYKTTWGMTIAEIKSALADEALTDSKDTTVLKGVSPLRINSFQIGGKSYCAFFVLDSTQRKLSAVALSSIEKPFPASYQQMKGLLIEKYGKPSFENEVPGKPKIIGGQVFESPDIFRSRWNLKGTTIELEYIDIKRGLPSYLSIYYSLAKPESKL